MSQKDRNEMEESGSNQNLVIPADRVPIAAYQAIYHRLTGRVETVSRRYSGSYSVSLNSIESLYHRLDQAIQQYQVQGRRCEFTVSAEAGESYRFTSLEKLQFSNLRALQKPIAAIGVEMDFLVVLPSEIEEGENIPQRYRVLVTVEDPRRIAERNVSRSFLSIELHEPDWPAGSVSISYADYAVGRNLLTLVDEWFGEIDVMEEGTISYRRQRLITKSADSFLVLLPISFLISGIVFEPSNYPSFISPIRYLLLILLLVLIAFVFAISASERIGVLTRTLRAETTFDISGGDQKKKQRRARSRKTAKTIISLMFVGVFLSFGVGLSVNYISKLLFG